MHVKAAGQELFHFRFHRHNILQYIRL
jgi:hypothetical protein